MSRHYLPTIILFGLAVWFFYDGWFNPEIEAVQFNRIGAPILLALAVFDFWRMRRRRANARSADGPSEEAGSGS